MATTNTVSGSLSLSALFRNLFTGDTVGIRQGEITFSADFEDTADLPDIIGMSGFIHSESVVCAAGDWRLATTSDPFGSMDDAQLHDVTVTSKPVVCVVIVNTDETNSITVKRGATNGLPIFDTAGAGVTIGPGGCHVFLDPTGAVTSAVTAANDKLTISVSGGAPVAEVLIVFGA